MLMKKRANKISRRSFIKLAGGATLAGTAMSLAGPADVVQAASNVDTANAYGVLVDIPKCIGCESCSVKCKK
jgi:NAD-dependent dihydropyrimidine dehydrogenase PreA subunit